MPDPPRIIDEPAEIGAARSGVVPATATGARATGARAIGAMAVGAAALGALALGALAIRRLAVGHARFRRLEIDELVVGTLRVTDELEHPPLGPSEP